ncbi:MAG: hypothetical protein HOJ62_17925, partial [Planctomycetaceae bacterium]|nr:hypothetical protein [Planctomycetaceae bacterium]
GEHATSDISITQTNSTLNQPLTITKRQDGIHYRDIETLQLWLSENEDTLNIESTHAGPTNIDTNDAVDTVNVQTTVGNLNIDTGNGDDQINIGTNAPTLGGTLNNIQGNINLNGELGGADKLTIDDSGDTTTNSSTLTKTSFSGAGLGGTITYTETEDLDIYLGLGGDTVDIESIHASTPTELWTAGGNDRINVGANTATVNDINNTLTIDAGSGTSDYLHVSDINDPTDNVVEITTTRVSGLGMGSGDQTALTTTKGVHFTQFETLEVNTGSGSDDITVNGPQADHSILHSSGGIDNIYIESTHGTLEVESGTASDTIVITGPLGGDTTVRGNAGDDHVLINYEDTNTAKFENAISQTFLNAIDGYEMTIEGNTGNDVYDIGLAGFGDSLIKVIEEHDDGSSNSNGSMNIYGSDVDDFFLFRLGAVIAYPRALASLAQPEQASVIERVNYDSNLDSGVNVYGRDGEDMFTFDDTSSVITAFGDDGDDTFQVGQMFKSPRDAYANLPEEDWFITTFTTRGYLSNGNSFSTSLYGGDGDDHFVVYHNLATLGLYGENDDDKFTVRAFVELNEEEAKNRLTNINGGQGGDFVEYAVNAPVDIDGGDGFDTMVIIGTEFGDDIVITEIGVYGAGLFVEYRGVESIEIDMAEGNDRFYVFGTPAGVSTNLIGGRGSDTFNVGGIDGLEDPLTVVSNDLRGHTGIINHTISTADENFSNLALSGISANVGDADSPGIMILETGTGTSVAESNNLGLQSIDAYDVILTMAPIENITITITPDPPKEDAFTAGARGIEVRKQGTTTFSDTLQLTFTPANWNISQTVEIQAQADVDQNNISIDVVEGTQNYVIKHTVIQGVDAGDEDAYDGLPIPSVLAEVIDTDAKDVVVRIGDISSDLVDAPWLHEAVELGGMTATYVVALTQVPSDTVSIVLTNTPDVTYSTNALVFTTANWETPQAVTVTVVDDLDKEGNHFATISHTISSNDDTYAAIGKFNVEFPVSDDDQPEILILPSTSTVNVIEPTTTKVVYDGVVSSATINSITMPSLVQDISSFSLGNNRSLWSSSNLSSTNRIQNWSTQPNSDIDNSTTRPHVTVDGVGSGNFAYYQFSVTSDMLSDGNGSVLGTFDIDGGKNSLQGSFDPYLYLYKQNLGFFGFPTATLLTSNDDSSVDAGSLHRYDSKIINYNFTSPGIYVVRVGRYPRNSTVPQGATYQLHVSLEHHNNNDNNLPTTNTFDGNTIVITSGTGKGQERTIAASNGLSGNTITVTSNWDDTPDVTSRFAVRKTIAGVATNTGHDQYTIVLTAAPTSDVTVNLVPQATKTYNDVLKFDESQNKGQRTAKQIFANTPSLTFTNSNWHVPQTITVSGITDNHIDGDAAISFPDAKRQVTDIRGPLSINGFEPDGQERDLEDPLLVPGELNLPPPDGAIVSAGDDDDNRAYITISGLPQNPYCITAVDWDLSTLTDDNQRRICSSKSDGTKYPGLPRNDWDQVDNIIGFEFTILGDIGNEATFIVSAPSDLSDPYEDD